MVNLTRRTLIKLEPEGEEPELSVEQENELHSLWSKHQRVHTKKVGAMTRQLHFENMVTIRHRSLALDDPMVIIELSGLGEAYVKRRLCQVLHFTSADGLQGSEQWTNVHPPETLERALRFPLDAAGILASEEVPFDPPGIKTRRYRLKTVEGNLFFYEELE